MRQLRLLMAAVSLAAMILVMSGMCAADVMMTASTTAPTYNSSEHPVLLLTGQTGPTVTGTISNPSAVVDFTANVDILYNGAVNGTPAVRAEDNSINNLTITIPGFTFTDVIFNIYGVYVGHEAINITVNLNDGSVTQSFDLRSGQTSRNWITIEAFNNEVINSVTINDAKFYALEDTHISGPTSTSAVPEPATLALVFSGLLGAGSRLRRRNRESQEVAL
jgi:hypothetical protein